MFGIILDYLRSDFLEEISRCGLLKLQQEVEYFMISSLQTVINERLNTNKVRFVVKTLGENGEQSSHYISADRAWFGSIPISVVARILDREPFPYTEIYFNFSEYIEIARSTTQDSCVIDRDGNICLYNAVDHIKTTAAVYGLKEKNYIHDITKGIVFLRDYYYSDEKKIDFMIGRLSFSCDKSTFVSCNLKAKFTTRGEIIAMKPTLCSKLRSECSCSKPHGTSLHDLITRILAACRNERVVCFKMPAYGTQLKEDSTVAYKMGILEYNQSFN